MASNNYTDLQANVALWLQRSDLTAVLPDMVILCEKKINRFLRTLEMQATQTTTSLTETTALPTDFLEVVSLAISFSNVSVNPTFISPGRMDELKVVTPTVAAIPEYYTIRSGNVELFPKPQSGTSFTMTLIYEQRIVPLATTATNWLLTNHWDVYFYGTLVEAEAFSRDDPRIGLWKQAYLDAIGEVKRMDSRKRFKGMTMDLGLPGIGPTPNTLSVTY